MTWLKRVISKIEKDGWKSIVPAISFQMKLWIDIVYRHFILRNRLIVQLFPMRTPPILLLSYPRSGSSWVGEILATSDELAYLFEPVNHPYQEYYRGPALADLSDPITYQAYSNYSQDAFLGMPPKKKYPGENLRGFSLIGRKRRRLLIKEVNPRAADFYCRRYHPTIIFLLRHPAAVALSFWELGWLASPDVQIDAVDLDGDDWEKFGYAYGVTMKNALKTVKQSKVKYTTILYENIASAPLSEFRKIFEYLGVKIPENYEDVIDEFCFSGTAIQGYQTRRISKKMIAKWKDKLSPEVIHQIQRGYFQSGLVFYQSDADW